MDIVINIAVFLIAAVIFTFVGVYIRKKVAESKLNSAENEAKQIIERAKIEAENSRKEEIFKAKEEILSARKDLDDEIRERRGEVQVQERRLVQKEENLERKLENVDKKERDLLRKEEELEVKKRDLKEITNKQMGELQRIAGLSKEEAKNKLLAELEKTMTAEKAALIREVENKAKEAAQKAIQSPLLEAQISGAKNAIVNITGGPAITIADSAVAVDYIREAAGSDLNIIYGVAINEAIGENIIVTVIATGFDLPKTRRTQPVLNQPSDSSFTRRDTYDEVVVNESEDTDIPVFFRTRK